eukprot:SAG31_NODE_2500_length_5595_cov_4.571143_7_plen_143_part_00
MYDMLSPASSSAEPRRNANAECTLSQKRDTVFSSPCAGDASRDKSATASTCSSKLQRMRGGGETRCHHQQHGEVVVARASSHHQQHLVPRRARVAIPPAHDSTLNWPADRVHLYTAVLKFLSTAVLNFKNLVSWLFLKNIFR